MERIDKQEAFWRDNTGALRLAIKEGREEGRKESREKGRKEGMKQEKIAIARSCKERGLDVETIMAITQLSREERV